MKKLLFLMLISPLWMHSQQEQLLGRPDPTPNNQTTTIDVRLSDAASIFNGGEVPNPNLIFLNDHQHGPNAQEASGQTINQYTSNVYAGNQVIWKINIDAESVAAGYSAELTQIEIKNGQSCIFGNSRIPGKGIILIGNVLEADDGGCKSEGAYPYKVRFLLRDADGTVRLFEFDPIMFVNN
ncbi:hypothetical protein [Robiginitalea sp. SC105]|uniref:hypothetical protein n=1 Tax=Robiginitalea sp. SC105 TaxID=2762332 RepID=UPI00163AE1AF|nr:hypothetical protein [Robiginitalea sp. SC105]MBC2840417.1 hypothetical protein [Robiginitalea sp. SC105]